MSLIVPDAVEIEVLTQVLTPALTLRLYSNDVTPDHLTSAASFTEVTGGGYASKPLTFANWTITPGDPSFGSYASQNWTFTGPTAGPGTIYGYYVTRNSDGVLIWSERFPSGVIPFVPIAGSVINVLPKFTAQSAF